MSKRRTKQQVERDALFAPGGSYDYGQFAGMGTAGFTPGTVQAGVKRGREAEFVAALAEFDDPATARLISEAGTRGLRTPAFRQALAVWVTERDRDGLEIPDAVDWQRRTP